MNAEEFMNKLLELDACEDAIEFCKGKSLEEAWDKCRRGDWMCWLAFRATNYNFKLMKLCNGHQANTVRDLIDDKRSIAAVDAVIAFGEGKITEKELSAAYYAAYSASYAAYADYSAYSAAYYAAYSASYAAYPAYAEYSAASYAAYASAYSASAAYSAAAAKVSNQLLTAEIARKYLPIPIF